MYLHRTHQTVYFSKGHFRDLEAKILNSGQRRKRRAKIAQAPPIRYVSDYLN
ncbi:hypothetical protein WN944_004393 [Citrus x changshan-huyou]|uniref:Uncharacterized protein n=1 Tax=Citrus x changshan-huyou TaxID=2935761 RepID=A0AAP0QM34_9ROSI